MSLYVGAAVGVIVICFGIYRAVRLVYREYKAGNLTDDGL